ncbi:caspase family protein [Dyella sp. 2RAF44]|uniref:caspase family protein n=1 Tax=Dyella sp. 2RAF44 TaxID=3233000 RepID=UPI003F8FDDA1
MEKNVTLIIGVRQSGRLPVLDGAWSDAHAFANWAKASERNYKVYLVTDEDGPVTIDRIKDVVSELLSDDVSRLLVFYSGHGICSQAGDYWLLTNYDRDSDEAVNCRQSILNARCLGIGQIAFFSDACRTSLNDAALTTGRSIFPRRLGQFRALSPCDEFMSTDIGNVAQEHFEGDSSLSYGVFSRCLLKALHGTEFDATELRAYRRVVSSAALATWLEHEVPLLSGKIVGGAVQYPWITASWRPPNDEYCVYDDSFRVEFKELSVVEDAQADYHFDLNEVALESNPVSPRMEYSIPKSQERIRQNQDERDRLIERRTIAFRHEQDRTSHTRHDGLVITGGEVLELSVRDGHSVELFRAADGWHVDRQNHVGSIALRMSSGVWIGASLLPGFLGTLVVGEHGTESLNYSPTSSQYEKQASANVDRTVARWNALLSVTRSVPATKLDEFAREVRQMKHINPALGILAAYAYERIGNLKEVGSVAWYFATRNGFVPYDVIALLEAYGELRDMPPGFRLDSSISGTASGFPLLTRGWSLLDSDNDYRRDLVRLKAGLTESVWTSFKSNAGERFASMIRKGRI